MKEREKKKEKKKKHMLLWQILHYQILFSCMVGQTTLNADCSVDEKRDAIVCEANCWICFLASAPHKK